MRKTRQHDVESSTHPHLGTFNLPLVSVAFVLAPFGLEVVEDIRKRVVLTVLGRERDLALLGALLLLWHGLLALLLQLLLLHLHVGAQHGELDGRVLRREEVGRASLWNLESRGLPRVGLHLQMIPGSATTNANLCTAVVLGCRAGCLGCSQAGSGQVCNLEGLCEKGYSHPTFVFRKIFRSRASLGLFNF